MEDIKTVHYVSKDAVQNFKVRVILTRLSVQKTRTNVVNPNAPPGVGAVGQQQLLALQQQQALAQQQQMLAQQQQQQDPAQLTALQQQQLLAMQQQQALAQQQQMLAQQQQMQPVPLPHPPPQPMPPAPGQQAPFPQPMPQPGASALAPMHGGVQPQPVQAQAVAEAYDAARRPPSSAGGSMTASTSGRRVRMAPHDSGSRQQQQQQQQQHEYRPHVAAGDPFAAASRARGRPLGEALEDEPPHPPGPPDPGAAAAAAAGTMAQQAGPAPLPPDGGGQVPGPGPVAAPVGPMAAAAAMQIPRQPVGTYVPYGLAPGQEGNMAATGKPPEVPPTTLPHLLPEKFTVSRVFGWQEKVYSRTEVAAAQSAAAAAQAAGQDPGLAPAQPPSKRTQALGSQSDLITKRLDPRIQGSILYTYVQTDEFGDAEELSRTVTTSLYEQDNALFTKMLSNPKNRQQVLNFRSMYVMADLADEQDAGAANQKVLLAIKAYADGSLDMCPGFSRPGFKYRFEDAHGGIYEYRVENASASEVPSLERRTAKLERAVVERAEELRRATLKLEFQPPPDEAGSVRLLLLAEIQSAADFTWDRLYVEYVVRWDPEVWELATPWPQQELGVVQGVTHVSNVTSYEADVARNTPARDVAHFAHPIELEWTSRGPPPPNRLPAMFFQVCTLDKLNRYTSQGYGWLSLDGKVPACGTHIIRTWKPLGRVRDLHAEFFIGGSPELLDLAYMTTPSGFDGKILNKYGFKTDTVGAIKVRTNTVVQRFTPDAANAARRRSSPLKAPPGPSAAAAAHRNRKDLSLKVVVERARQRLREARGVDDAAPGTDIAVRQGLVSEAPTVVVHPADTVAAEETTARFKVVARGLPPLKYEWYKDDRRLAVATADQPELILVQASLDNEGAYYCQVSNKDGSVNSAKANLTVTRAARLSRATGEPESGRVRQQRSPAGGGRRVRGSRLGRISDTGQASPSVQASQVSGVSGESMDGGDGAYPSLAEQQSWAELGAQLAAPAMPPAPQPQAQPQPLQAPQGFPAGVAEAIAAAAALPAGAPGPLRRRTGRLADVAGPSSTDVAGPPAARPPPPPDPAAGAATGPAAPRAAGSGGLPPVGRAAGRARREEEDDLEAEDIA